MSIDVCTLLFKQIDKPKNFEICKAINVYDNKYRINVYTRIYDQVYDIEKKRITHSYFARLDGDKLQLLA
jgi:hypothetical protein